MVLTSWRDRRGPRTESPVKGAKWNVRALLTISLVKGTLTDCPGGGLPRLGIKNGTGCFKRRSKSCLGMLRLSVASLVLPLIKTSAANTFTESLYGRTLTPGEEEMKEENGEYYVRWFENRERAATMKDCVKKGERRGCGFYY